MPKASSLKNTSKPKIKAIGKTKQKLMDAGLELFTTRGFNGVTVSELEDAVGLKAGSGSFYRHFTDKEELFKAIMEREIVEAKERRYAELEALSNGEEDTRFALKKQFKLTLKGLRENHMVFNLISREREQFPGLFKLMINENLNKALETVVELYSKKVSNGTMVHLDPMLITLVVESSLFGFSQSSILYGSQTPEALEEKFIETLLDLIVIKN